MKSILPGLIFAGGLGVIGLDITEWRWWIMLTVFVINSYLHLINHRPNLKQNEK
jgi:hypothetical protein